MDEKKEAKPAMGRRDFLRVASVGAAAGVVAVASGEAEATDLSTEGKASGGYAKTDHVAKYYELANI